MSIRYECDGCGSVVKIKESLAGTSGKCPTCRKKFVVPQKGADSGIRIDSAADSVIEKNPPTQTEPASKKEEIRPAPAAPLPPQPSPPASASTPESDSTPDGFDLDTFLMDDSAPGAKASAGLTAPPPTAPAATPPKFDKFGRRTFAPPTPPAGAKVTPPADPVAATPATTPPSATAAAAPTGQSAPESPEAPVEGAAVKPAIKSAGPRKPLIRINFSGLGRQLRKYGLYVVLEIVLIAGLFWLSAQYMTTPLPLPKLGAVSGIVTLNGKPLKNVDVHLTPIDPRTGISTSGVKISLRDSVGTTDSEGRFVIHYVGSASGAPLGKVRVWLVPNDPADFKKIPPAYLTNGSADIRDVKAVGNEKKFDVELKTSK